MQEASDEGQKGQDPPAPQEGPTVPPEAHKSKEEPQSAEVKEDAERNPPPEQSQPSQDEQQQEKKEDTEQTVQSNISGKETGEDRGDSATEKSKPGTAEEKVKEKKKKRAKSRDSTSGERKKEDMPKLKKRLSTAGSTVRRFVSLVVNPGFSVSMILPTNPPPSTPPPPPPPTHTHAIQYCGDRLYNQGV